MNQTKPRISSTKARPSFPFQNPLDAKVACCGPPGSAAASRAEDENHGCQHLRAWVRMVSWASGSVLQQHQRKPPSSQPSPLHRRACGARPVSALPPGQAEDYRAKLRRNRSGLLRVGAAQGPSSKPSGPTLSTFRTRAQQQWRSAGTAASAASLGIRRHLHHSRLPAAPAWRGRVAW